MVRVASLYLKSFNPTIDPSVLLVECQSSQRFTNFCCTDADVPSLLVNVLFFDCLFGVEKQSILVDHFSSGRYY